MVMGALIQTAPGIYVSRCGCCGQPSYLHHAALRSAIEAAMTSPRDGRGANVTGISGLELRATGDTLN